MGEWDLDCSCVSGEGLETFHWGGQEFRSPLLLSRASFFDRA